MITSARNEAGNTKDNLTYQAGKMLINGNQSVTINFKAPFSSVPVLVVTVESKPGQLGTNDVTISTVSNNSATVWVETPSKAEMVHWFALEAV